MKKSSYDSMHDHDVIRCQIYECMPHIAQASIMHMHMMSDNPQRPEFVHRGLLLRPLAVQPNWPHDVYACGQLHAHE